MPTLAFIFDESLHYNTDHGDMAQAVSQARNYRCPRCPHTHGKPWPAFPTPADFARAQHAKVVIRSSFLRVKKDAAPAAAGNALAANGMAEDGWTVVSRKKFPVSQPAPASAQKGTTPAPAPEKDTKKAEKKLGPVKVIRLVPKGTLSGQNGSYASVGAAKAAEPAVSQSSSATASLGSHPANITQSQRDAVKKAERSAPISVTALRNLAIAPPVSSIPSSVTSSISASSDIATDTKTAPAMVANAGRLALPYEILLQIISLPTLTPRDIASLSLACRHLRAVTQDGHLWRTVFRRAYPKSNLNAASLSDWKLAFALESNHVADEMRCYATKMGWEEDVLGLPVVYTVNPKKKKVDYISCEAELVSRTAVVEDGVRLTVWNTKFTEWLPVYITEEHFRRALPDIRNFMVKMSPHWGTHAFKPEMVLEVIPKMMNTLIVLLCDHGISVSSRAIESYFLLHRLLTALLDEYPSLRRTINDRVNAFISDESNRTKEALPSLGDFLPLLSFSQHSWMDKRVHNAVIGELMDRSILWLCREYPELAKVPARAGEPKADMEVLRKTWEAGKVSRRLGMFHCYALWLFRNQGGAESEDLKAASDMLFGRPPKKVVNNFEVAVKRILAVDSWPAYFRACYLAPPSPALLTWQLQQAVRNSLRKGYHRRNMDFSKIQRSGVSKILLKGESYSAPPNLKKVVMEEAWRYPGNNTLFLDASCSAFDFEGNHMQNIDYARQSAFGSAIRHSGDIIDHATRHGRHTIQIDIPRLPETVKALVFCMSAWTTPLTDIRDPYVRLVSPVDGEDVELCKYQFVGNTGTNTAIVMCALWRAAKGGRKWEVK
ncbi:hypothetical protein HK104_009537, partial [Borealophlyctis nickersoniae]